MKLYSWVTSLFLLALVLALSAACATGGAPPAGLNPKEKAAAEATAIIQSAEATALILQAQAQATALLQSASASGPTPVPTMQTPAPTIAPLPTLKPAMPTATATALPLSSLVGEATATAKAGSSAVQLVAVSVREESGLIIVQFKAPPSVANKWQQGIVYVVDETTGTVYNEIPVLPSVGPLFGRPKEEGQIGYVMLVNPAPGLRPGSVVTVVLGDFKQEHVMVQ